MGLVCELHILPYLGQCIRSRRSWMHPLRAVLPSESTDIMLPAQGEHLIEMFDKRVLALVHQHERAGDRAAF